MLRRVKKIPASVDNFPVFDENRVKLYTSIHEYADAGFSGRAIAKILHCSRNTVAKYLEGDRDCLCRRDVHGRLGRYYDFIIKELSAGVSRKDVYDSLVAAGYEGSRSAAYVYMNKLVEQFHIDIAVYKSASAEAIQKKKELQEYVHMSRSEVFRFIWMGAEIDENHKTYLFDTYPQLKELYSCIREFRRIFLRKNMPLLYLFIEKYKASKLKSLSRFAAGLEKDLAAVENAVASPLSNGFVEGTNSKLKMVKRTMYGRCNRTLLAAKLMYLK